MRMLEKWQQKRHQKKREKAEALRRKNAKLRAQGIEPVKKGWGPMVNSGFGGLNKTEGTIIGKGLETSYRKHQAEEISSNKKSPQ